MYKRKKIKNFNNLKLNPKKRLLMIFKSGGGFTLLEVMVAISVMTLAVAGSFILIQQTLVAASLGQSKLIASYLAQEGFEIVRNIRDSNWLEQRYDSTVSWDEGISPGESSKDYIADYTDDLYLRPFEDIFLRLDDDGFYNYDSGQSTVFKRKISITKNDPPDSIKVEVLVEWSERGRNHNFSAQEYLYNWYRLE